MLTGRQRVWLFVWRVACAAHETDMHVFAPEWNVDTASRREYQSAGLPGRQEGYG